MAITRITQNMMAQQSLTSLQASMGRLSVIQEQVTTGRVLNRPSDSPTDTAAAMRIRASLSDQKQYARNGQDGLGWLGQIDSTLSAMTDQLRRARGLALQGANTGATTGTAQEALASEIDQIRASLLSSANTTYLDRPVFGGVTSGSAAYDSAGAFIGVSAAVSRTVSDGVRIAVDVDGPAVFGTTGDSMFDELAALAAALRAGDSTGIQSGLTALTARMDTMTAAQADVGTRSGRVERSVQAANDAVLALTTSLSEIENTDLIKAMVDLQMQETAHQAALAATSRVMQPSLLDFLR